MDSPTYQRYGNAQDPGIAIRRELDRLSPLKGVDGLKRRLEAAVEDGRNRVRGAIY